jgi:hypothetical protein
MKRFSAEDVSVLRSMAVRGHGGKEIAVRLGRTPQSVRVKCVELGIALRDVRKHVWHGWRSGEAVADRDSGA